ncbi:MAG TPA: aspartate kinase, monofunctional class [Roseiflexaceae bacterium]|nr:aspartate kinase, monofunctional class [Roseiflexaceae bacterium]
MSLLVMKFGGTSVGNATAIEQLAAITRAQLETWDNVVVVVSAMSGVTDMLLQGAQAAIQAAHSSRPVAIALLEKHLAASQALLGDSDEAAVLREQIEQLVAEFELLCRSVSVLGEVSPRATDAIASLGERMSVRLVAAALRAREIPAEAIDATELIVTTPHFGNAVPIHDATRVRTNARVRPLLERGIVPVITGFIGATEAGAITTLGRGGSDYSGAIVGSALDADEVAIYTDVDGVMTTDPRLVASARVIDTLSYSEMGELAYFGAKVLHPRTIRPVVEREIPLRIRNTFNPDHAGTLVVREAQPNGRFVKAVSVVRGMSLITVEGRGMIGIPGVAARTFGAVASVGANVLMISQASSEQSICFVVQTNTVDQVTRALEDGLASEIARRDIDRVSADDGVVIVTAVGAGMRDTPGVAASVFGALAERRINVIAIAQGSSECAISTVVRAEDADDAVRAIHNLAV